MSRPDGLTEFDYNTNGTVQKISHVSAALPAVFPTMSAGAVRIWAGLIMGSIGASMGSKYGLEGALIGGVAGFVGGMLGSAAGYNAYQNGVTSGLPAAVSPPPKIPESAFEPVIPTLDNFADPQPDIPVGALP